MRSVLKIFIALLGAAAMTACSGLDDDSHYSSRESRIENGEMKIVDMSSEQYIKSRGDLSSMDGLFEKDSVYDRLRKKDQVSTLLVVTNDNYKEPAADRLAFVADSHVSDIAISPSNMYDGERLMMWHGKYVSIGIDSLGRQGQIVGHIMLNTAAVKEAVKTNDGYIYVISDMITTPTSLFDYIQNLDDNYSEFKKLVLGSGTYVFDKQNSKPVGVNDEGNTVYDSVFVYHNDFFSAKGFDMNSESLTATMLLFSNDVIEDAMRDANARLASWGLERNQDTLRHWILKAAFFNKRYAPEEIETATATDLRSIYGEQWRTSVQKVDAANPVELSNAIVYKVEKLHLPTNLLIYRLKDYFYYYENCSDTEKEQYFKMINMRFNSCSTEVDAWTPWSGVWPTVFNRILRLDKSAEASDADGFELDFTPLMLRADGSVRPYTVPPGAYRLAMGFVQNTGLDIRVDVLVGGKVIASSPLITLGSSTTYHYDRGATLSNTYPEGYDATLVRQKGGSSKAGNYDTDGGPVIDEVVIPDVKGDGSPVELQLKITCDNWAGKSMVKLHHWCLRPTVNNY